MKVPTGLARVDAANNDVDVWAYFALGVAGVDGVDADDRVYLSCVYCFTCSSIICAHL